MITSEQQAMRYERRRRELERERRARENVKRAIAALLGFILAMTVMAAAEGGVSDAELEAAEIAYWQEQGVEISRW